MKAQHTPGPWHVHQRTERNGCGTITFQEIGAETSTGKYALCLNLIDGDGKDHSARNARALADARLIAAAPDLLSALLAVEEWFADHGPPLGMSQRAHQERVMRAAITAAIAKAEAQP